MSLRNTICLLFLAYLIVPVVAANEYNDCSIYPDKAGQEDCVKSNNRRRVGDEIRHWDLRRLQRIVDDLKTFAKKDRANSRSTRFRNTALFQSLDHSLNFRGRPLSILSLCGEMGDVPVSGSVRYMRFIVSYDATDPSWTNAMIDDMAPPSTDKVNELTRNAHKKLFENSWANYCRSGPDNLPLYQ